MKRHLDSLVCILVVHVVNNVHGIHVHAGQPIHHLFIADQHIIEVEILALDGFVCRSNLFAGELISTAIDCIQQALGEIRAGAKKLHLLANQHWRDTTRNGAIIAPCAAHDLVAFELNGTRINRYLGNKTAESSGQTR